MFILSFTDGDSVDGAMKQGSLSMPGSDFVDRTAICNNA